DSHFTGADLSNIDSLERRPPLIPHLAIRDIGSLDTRVVFIAMAGALNTMHGKTHMNTQQ
ncbi:MAG: hypothetical protein AB2793_05285, partial [Candidatus Thiodiazotropha sp.]